MSTLKRILLTPERGGLTSNVRLILEHLSCRTWADHLKQQGLVYRYDVNKADDGVGGEEGTFCLCTLWYCDIPSTVRFAGTNAERAGRSKPSHAQESTTLPSSPGLSPCSRYVAPHSESKMCYSLLAIQDFLQYTNHVGLCTEEISPAGDGLGNAVQGFT